MILNRHARRYWRLEITTDPPIDAASWEASFDAGTTWHPATTVNGLPAWLIAGPDADPGAGPTAAVAVITDTLTPVLRAVDNPEVEAFDAEFAITVT